MEFIANNLAPIMFAGLICFLLIGFPVAFSLGACGLFFAVIGIEMGVLPEALMQALPLRIYGVMQNETLLAIPFFTLMGLILERSGMAEDLLDTVGQLFGPIRGGVAIAVIVVTPFFNAFTFPCLSTVATFLLEDVHLTSLISASDGETTAFNVSVAPFFIPAFVLFNVIFLTFTSFFSVSGFFSVSFSGAFLISPSFPVNSLKRRSLKQTSGCC